MLPVPVTQHFMVNAIYSDILTMEGCFGEE